MKESIILTHADGTRQEWLIKTLASTKSEADEYEPGDWWIKDYAEGCMSYVFLEKIDDDTVKVLITKESGEILLTNMSMISWNILI